ncbi:MAG TPA: lysine exporter LysO family protein, partial [Clostridia bacterium]|nr:lysine exporter LysO family protein [Clostridia bacterium]
ALASLDALTSISLAALVITIGIDLGKNRHTWIWLRRAGIRVVLLPGLVVIGTLAGSLAAGFLAGIPANESLAVGAGFGWYSLSGALLSKIYRADTGALAFLANVARELGAVVLMPLIARCGLKATVVAPGGATTMDTTLPLILRLTDHETAVLGLANGIVLTILVPLLVPILIGLR